MNVIYGFLLLQAAQASEQQAEVMLDLVEINRRVLPAAADVRSAALGTTGRLAVLVGRKIYLITGDTIAELCPDQVIVPLGHRFLPGDSILEVIDRESRSLLYARRSGCEVVAQIDGVDGWARAVSVDAGWVALSLTEEGTEARVVMVNRHGKVLGSTGVLGHHSPRELNLVSAGSTALIVPLSLPVRWYELRTVERVKTVACDDPGRAPELAEGMSEPRTLGVHAIGRERFIAIVADLRSDKRLLLLLDSSGCVERSVQLDVPIGVLAMNETAGTLLMIQRTNEVELVSYQVRWRRLPPTTGVER